MQRTGDRSAGSHVSVVPLKDDDDEVVGLLNAVVGFKDLAGQ
jgi:hypothetical protein